MSGLCLVFRMAGPGADAAGKVLQKASDRVSLERDIGAALDLAAAHAAGATG